MRGTADRAAWAPAAIALAALVVVAGCGLGDSSGSPSASFAPAASPASSAGPPGSPAATGLTGGDPDKLLGRWLSSPLHGNSLGDVSASAEAACRSAMLRAGGPFALGSAPLILLDARGAAILWLLFATADAAVDCRVALAADLSVGEVSLRVWQDLGPAPADDGIAYVDYGALDVPVLGQVTVVVGRVGRDSFDVIATFPDESNTVASHGSGWWLLWWNGTTRPVGIGGVDRHHVVVAGLAPPTLAP